MLSSADSAGSPMMVQWLFGDMPRASIIEYMSSYTTWSVLGHVQAAGGAAKTGLDYVGVGLGYAKQVYSYPRHGQAKHSL